MTTAFWTVLWNIPLYSIGAPGSIMQLSFLCMCVCVYLADNCDLAVTEFAAILDGENVLFIEGVVLQLRRYV